MDLTREGMIIFYRDDRNAGGLIGEENSRNRCESGNFIEYDLSEITV